MAMFVLTKAAAVMAIVIQYCAGYNTAPVRDTRDPVGADIRGGADSDISGPAGPPSAAAPLSPSAGAPLRRQLRSAPPSTPLRSALNSALPAADRRPGLPPRPLTRGALAAANKICS